MPNLDHDPHCARLAIVLGADYSAVLTILCDPQHPEWEQYRGMRQVVKAYTLLERYAQEQRAKDATDA